MAAHAGFFSEKIATPFPLTNNEAENPYGHLSGSSKDSANPYARPGVVVSGQHGLWGRTEPLDWVLELDQDDNGSITQSEVDQARTKKMASFDSDGDGTLSLDEYRTLWLDRMSGEMVDAFQASDADGNGQVTKEEFNALFSNLVARLDTNGDGVVSSAG
ncbi:EF-hand domain-containing protein [Consotaella aegiceratis]|uniref:EF-hand domain-containing protein n=1 Tax=Consotaella aegiceratis TaxID=3097961 RepID=UPI002F416474